MNVQAPALHTATPLAGGLQTAQAAPQLVALSALHTPPHARKPALHATPQVDVWHVATPFGVEGHPFVQAPQWSGSLARSTQAPLHAVRPAAHDDAQALFEQTRPAAHGSPQPPQLVGLLSMLVSQPSLALSLQSARVPSHVPTAQALSRQVATP
ncbi:MAG TPA: hypothetical protein VM925_08935 [Labilithrix sp.]|nr:hypothetical protein [Labilithrix sp.]